MEEKQIIQKILQGKIFIYPTDTVYGLGCNAENKESVEKIRQIKERDNKPLSIIAPSVNWIKNNCKISEKEKNLIEKYLPGPYTLILEKKNPEFLNHVSDLSSLGIRIPDCDFSKYVEKAGIPFITTSVNLSGQPFLLSLNDLKENIKNQVDIIIPGNENKMTGKPSSLIINGEIIARK